MPNGGKLYVTAERRGGRVVITVKDTGGGIPKDLLPNIFSPFSSTKSAGMGLGLAFSKAAVEAHGGTINVESKEGEGTTFTIDLPLEKDQG
jgi:signal transduction histidine kinase